MHPDAPAETTIPTTTANPNQTTIPIEFELTPAETKRVESLSERGRRGSEHSPLKYWAIIALIAIPLSIGGYHMIREGGLVWLGILLVVWLIVFLVLRKSSAQRQSALSRRTTLLIHPDGPTFSDGLTRSDLPWPAISRASDTSDFFMITRDGVTWHFVPKRAFATPQLASQFGQLLREHVDSSSLRRAMNLPPLHPLPADPHAWRVRFSPLMTFGECAQTVFASWSIRLAAGALVVIYFAVMMKVSADLAVENRHVEWDAWLFGLIPVVLPLLFFAAVFTLRLWWALNQRKTIFVELDDAGVTFSSADGKDSRAWTTFGRFKETRRSFIVWQRLSRNHLIIPKRTLPDDQTRKWLEQTLHSNLEPSTWFFLI